MDDAKVHTEAAKVHTAHITAHIEAVTAHSATITDHTAPRTITPPFEPAATTHEKMAKPFLFERGFAPSDPHRLLFERGFAPSDPLRLVLNEPAQLGAQDVFP